MAPIIINPGLKYEYPPKNVLPKKHRWMMNDKCGVCGLQRENRYIIARGVIKGTQTMYKVNNEWITKRPECK